MSHQALSLPNQEHAVDLASKLSPFFGQKFERPAWLEPVEKVNGVLQPFFLFGNKDYLDKWVERRWDGRTSLSVPEYILEDDRAMGLANGIRRFPGRVKDLIALTNSPSDEIPNSEVQDMANRTIQDIQKVLGSQEDGPQHITAAERLGSAWAVAAGTDELSDFVRNLAAVMSCWHDLLLSGNQFGGSSSDKRLRTPRMYMLATILSTPLVLFVGRDFRSGQGHFTMKSLASFCSWHDSELRPNFPQLLNLKPSMMSRMREYVLQQYEQPKNKSPYELLRALATDLLTMADFQIRALEYNREVPFTIKALPPAGSLPALTLPGPDIVEDAPPDQNAVSANTSVGSARLGVRKRALSTDADTQNGPEDAKRLRLHLDPSIETTLPTASSTATPAVEATATTTTATTATTTAAATATTTDHVAHVSDVAPALPETPAVEAPRPLGTPTVEAPRPLETPAGTAPAAATTRAASPTDMEVDANGPTAATFEAPTTAVSHVSSPVDKELAQNRLETPADVAPAVATTRAASPSDMDVDHVSPTTATGDASATAVGHGGKPSDTEFVQNHPQTPTLAESESGHSNVFENLSMLGSELPPLNSSTGAHVVEVPGQHTTDHTEKGIVDNPAVASDDMQNVPTTPTISGGPNPNDPQTLVKPSDDQCPSPISDLTPASTPSQEDDQTGTRPNDGVSDDGPPKPVQPEGEDKPEDPDQDDNLVQPDDDGFQTPEPKKDVDPATGGGRDGGKGSSKGGAGRRRPVKKGGRTKARRRSRKAKNDMSEDDEEVQEATDEHDDDDDRDDEDEETLGSPELEPFDDGLGLATDVAARDPRLDAAMFPGFGLCYDSFWQKRLKGRSYTFFERSAEPLSAYVFGRDALEDLQELHDLDLDEWRDADDADLVMEITAETEEGVEMALREALVDYPDTVLVARGCTGCVGGGGYDIAIRHHVGSMPMECQIPGFLDSNGRELCGNRSIFMLHPNQFLNANKQQSTGGINWLSGTTEDEYLWTKVVRHATINFVQDWERTALLMQNNGHASPGRQINFVIGGNDSAYSSRHVDAAGFGTVVDLLTGKKIWWLLFANPEEYPDVFNDPTRDPRTIPFKYWKVHAVRLSAGDLLVMPPGTLHCVLTIEASVTRGGHYLSDHVLSRTVRVNQELSAQRDPHTNASHHTTLHVLVARHVLHMMLRYDFKLYNFAAIGQNRVEWATDPNAWPRLPNGMKGDNCFIEHWFAMLFIVRTVAPARADNAVERLDYADDTVDHAIRKVTLFCKYWSMRTRDTWLHASVEAAIKRMTTQIPSLKVYLRDKPNFWVLKRGDTYPPCMVTANES